jgi:carboxypeptidase PM20D1
MKRTILVLALGLVAAAGLLLARAAALRPTQPAVGPAPAVALEDPDAAIQRLAGAIRIATISHQDPADDDPAVFQAFRDHLERSFPALSATLQRELVNERALLYTWRGRDPSQRPVVLMAHQDVVPVEPGTEASWREPPFSGAVADGFVWGRGTLDTKGKLVAVCEAVDRLIRAGFQPTRTTYLVFGADEEVGGRRGAFAIAERLRAQGVQLEWVLDEGGFLAEGLVPGVAAPVALVGIAEKGYLTVSLTAHAEGGHSSMPPPQTAIGILAAAVARLEAHPMPAALRGATDEMLGALAPEMAFPLRVAVANRDLLGPVLVRALARTPRGNAAVRTTTAVTMIQGGVKENALPASARALVNFRLLPGDGIESVLAHVRRAVDDPRVEVAVADPTTALEPSPESRVDSDAFALLARTIRETHPDAVVAPDLVLGGTDARYFRPLSENVYRFGPLRLGPDDLKRAHGTDERIGVDDYLDSIRFYERLLQNAG